MVSIVFTYFYSSGFASAGGTSRLFSLSCSAAARALASASIYRTSNFFIGIAYNRNQVSAYL